MAYETHLAIQTTTGRTVVALAYDYAGAAWEDPSLGEGTPMTEIGATGVYEADVNTGFYKVQWNDGGVWTDIAPYLEFTLIDEATVRRSLGYSGGALDLGDANQVGYTPADAGDYTGTPTEGATAADELAERLQYIDDMGTGAVVATGSRVYYSPTVAGDWAVFTSTPDDMREALDNLAEYITDYVALTGAVTPTGLDSQGMDDGLILRCHTQDKLVCYFKLEWTARHTTDAAVVDSALLGNIQNIQAGSDNATDYVTFEIPHDVIARNVAVNPYADDIIVYYRIGAKCPGDATYTYSDIYSSNIVYLHKSVIYTGIVSEINTTTTGEIAVTTPFTMTFHHSAEFPTCTGETGNQPDGNAIPIPIPQGIEINKIKIEAVAEPGANATIKFNADNLATAPKEVVVGAADGTGENVTMSLSVATGQKLVIWSLAPYGMEDIYITLYGIYL